MDRPVFQIQKKEPTDVVIALMGNPNVGKSTVFNALTGLKQHTGNWPGKTVSIAQGRYTYKGKGYILVDLPGTYSLLSQSEEERVAVEFLRSGLANCVVVVADASCLERNLSLALQTMELHDQILICVNLMDEALRHGIIPDVSGLERELGVPVVGTSAAKEEGLELLMERIRNLNDGFLPIHPHKLGVAFDTDTWHQQRSDRASRAYSKRAEEIARSVVTGETPVGIGAADRLVLGRWSGRILLIMLLLGIFWLTIEGANVPSMILQAGFDRLYLVLDRLLMSWPFWMKGLLLDGVYATSARVIAVMLPPMAIFFPLFTLLEDLGYLPRVAFLMDNSFSRCGSCGKQVLTMAMGFGCNAAGVMGCRIISSPKERLLAVLTNGFVPCNGKFPALIALISLFFSDNSLIAACLLTGFVLLGVAVTLLATGCLSKTVLHEQESRFILEIPPYRVPRWRKILIRAFLDRTVFVLGRAAAVAAPAGAVLWCMQQMTIGDIPCLLYLSQLLEPLGRFLGLNGIILLAFFLSIPANELLLPCIVMLLMGGTAMVELGTEAMGQLLMDAGWTWKTALCTTVFLLFHWPCSTTCLTIRRETGSWKWTFLAMLLPMLTGLLLCGLLANL